MDVKFGLNLYNKYNNIKTKTRKVGTNSFKNNFKGEYIEETKDQVNGTSIKFNDKKQYLIEIHKDNTLLNYMVIPKNYLDNDNSLVKNELIEQHRNLIKLLDFNTDRKDIPNLLKYSKPYIYKDCLEVPNSIDQTLKLITPYLDNDIYELIYMRKGNKATAHQIHFRNLIESELNKSNWKYDSLNILRYLFKLLIVCCRLENKYNSTCFNSKYSLEEIQKFVKETKDDDLKFLWHILKYYEKFGDKVDLGAWDKEKVTKSNNREKKTPVRKTKPWYRLSLIDILCLGIYGNANRRKSLSYFRKMVSYLTTYRINLLGNLVKKNMVIKDFKDNVIDLGLKLMCLVTHLDAKFILDFDYENLKYKG